MKTIVLFISNPILKMTVIRILMTNNLYYVEASSVEELFIKLDLVKDAGLLIQDYAEEKEADIMEALFKANLLKLPILWIMPSEKSNQVPDRAKEYITDILLSPFQPAILLRKIKGIINIEEKMDKVKKKDSVKIKLSSSHKEKTVEAMECAARGRYPLCIVRLHITGAYMELNLQILDELNQILRRSDQIIEVDIGEFIILCPYTPQQSSQIVENKIKDAVVSILQNTNSACDLNLYTTNFPEKVQSYRQLEAKLFTGEGSSSD